MATAQMRRATRPMTEYSASRPLKKEEEVGREIVDAHAPGEVGLDDDGLRNIARTAARPLIVIDTEMSGAHRSKPS